MMYRPMVTEPLVLVSLSGRISTSHVLSRDHSHTHVMSGGLALHNDRALCRRARCFSRKQRQNAVSVEFRSDRAEHRAPSVSGQPGAMPSALALLVLGQACRHTRGKSRGSCPAACAPRSPRADTARREGAGPRGPPAGEWVITPCISAGREGARCSTRTARGASADCH